MYINCWGHAKWEEKRGQMGVQKERKTNGITGSVLLIVVVVPYYIIIQQLHSFEITMEICSHLVSEIPIDDLCLEESTLNCPLSPCLLPTDAPKGVLDALDHFLLE